MDAWRSTGPAPADVPALLHEVAGIGPFFAVATGREPPGGGWVPVRALSGEPVDADDPLLARIAAIRAALGTDERVAASTAFQGLAAQLVAPLFAAVAIARALPAPGSGGVGPGALPGCPDHVRDVRCPESGFQDTRGHPATGDAPSTAGTSPVGLADVLHWRPGGDGPWLWWRGAGHVVPGSAAALGDVLVELLAPLVAAVRARVPIAERVLWGNAASAVASGRGLVAAARPDAAARATAVAQHLLTTAPLAPTAALRAPGPSDLRWTFRRRSCCLYYRVAGGEICGDCVLRDRRRPHHPPGPVR